MLTIPTIIVIVTASYFASMFNAPDGLAMAGGHEWVDSRGGINQLLNNAIPEEATDIEYSGYSIMQAASAQASFKIPAEKLPELLSGLGFTKPLEQGLCPFGQLCENSMYWWKPQDAQVFAGGDIDYGGYNVMIDMTDSEIYIIYVLMYFD